MTWAVRIARAAQKSLSAAPGEDRARLIAALAEMRGNPFAGDIGKIEGSRRKRYRRRIGSGCNRRRDGAVHDSCGPSSFEGVSCFIVQGASDRMISLGILPVSTVRADEVIE